LRAYARYGTTAVTRAAPCSRRQPAKNSSRISLSFALAPGSPCMPWIT
jgi:hypothetical protein